MQHRNADILTMLVLPAKKTTGKLLILILLMSCFNCRSRTRSWAWI